MTDPAETPFDRPDSEIGRAASRPNAEWLVAGRGCYTDVPGLGPGGVQVLAVPRHRGRSGPEDQLAVCQHIERGDRTIAVRVEVVFRQATDDVVRATAAHATWQFYRDVMPESNQIQRLHGTVLIDVGWQEGDVDAVGLVLIAQITLG